MLLAADQLRFGALLHNPRTSTPRSGLPEWTRQPKETGRARQYGIELAGWQSRIKFNITNAWISPRAWLFISVLWHLRLLLTGFSDEELEVSELSSDDTSDPLEEKTWKQ